METTETISEIKQWLGNGSINIFGLPYSGKDTVGIRLAELLGGRFLSSGLILREAEKEDKDLKLSMMQGALVPQDKFKQIVLPYFFREDIKDFPLVLSSVGRWSGEETEVMNVAKDSEHEMKAAILLNISEADIKSRWEQARVLQDRGKRADDKDLKVLDNRIKEFREKTMPVVATYQKLGLLVPVRADMSRNEVFEEVLKNLLRFIRKN